MRFVYFRNRSFCGDCIMNQYIFIFGEDNYSYKIKVAANTVTQAQYIATTIVETELTPLPLKDIIVLSKE